jgi:hypothetical protein
MMASFGYFLNYIIIDKNIWPQFEPLKHDVSLAEPLPADV